MSFEFCAMGMLLHIRFGPVDYGSDN